MNHKFTEILAAADNVGVGPTKEQMDVVGYEALQMVLQMAYEQASGGKGNERHASNGLSQRPFHGQPMQTECDEIGSVDGLVYQVRKKTREGNKLPTTQRQINEWLGAINYLAGCVIWKLRHEGPPTLKTEENGMVEPRASGDALYAVYEGPVSTLTSDHNVTELKFNSSAEIGPYRLDNKDIEACADSVVHSSAKLVRAAIEDKVMHEVNKRAEQRVKAARKEKKLKKKVKAKKELDRKAADMANTASEANRRTQVTPKKRPSGRTWEDIRQEEMGRTHPENM